MCVFRLRVSDLTYDATIYEVIETLGIFGNIVILIIFCIQSKCQIILLNQLINTKNFIVRQNMALNTKKLCRRLSWTFIINLILRLMPIITIGNYGYRAIILRGGLDIGYSLRNAIILQYYVILNVIAILFETVNDSLSNEKSTYSIDEKLTRVYESHVKLRRLSQEISRFYSLPVLLCILCDFSIVLSEIYFIAKPTFTKESYSLYAIDYIHVSLSPLNYGFSMVLLTSSVRNTIDEVIVLIVFYKCTRRNNLRKRRFIIIFITLKQSNRTCEIIFDYLQNCRYQEIKNKVKPILKKNYYSMILLVYL